MGHHLEVVVQIGSAGVTKGVISATSQALQDHELVKVKVAMEREGRDEAISALAEGAGAEVAQTLGRTALLYKKRAKNSKLWLDGEEKPAPVVEKPAKKPAKPKPVRRKP